MKKILFSILTFLGIGLSFCSADGIYLDSTGGVISIDINGQYYTISDKNLGATCNDISNSCSYGNYFQYGNNYGFTAGNVSTTNTLIDGSNYGPGNYYSDRHYVTQSNIFSVLNTNIWGFASGTYESMQGPCPSGYHIPTKDEFSNLLSVVYQHYSFQGVQNGLLLPRGGNLDIDSSLVNVGGPATFITSSIGLGNDSTWKSVFIMWSDNRYTLDEQPNGYGAPLRCFKNGFVEPTYNWERLVGDIIVRPKTIDVIYNNGNSTQTFVCDDNNSIFIDGLSTYDSNTFTPYFNIYYRDEDNQSLVESYSKSILYLNGLFKKTYTGDNEWILTAQGGSSESEFTGYLPTFDVTGSVDPNNEFTGNVFNNFADNSLKFLFSNIPSYIQYFIIIVIFFLIIGFVKKFRRSKK